MAITFGTGGLRGLMGSGDDRINAQTVARATRAVAAWLLKTDEALARRGGVAIAYDTRHQSADLAQVTAETFAACGLPAHLFSEPMPTPTLSFAVRHLGCAGGIVVTASHNTSEYNGYKVYNREGCQLVPEEAEAVLRHMDSGAEDTDAAAVHAVPGSVARAYLSAVLGQSLLHDATAKAALSVVYTPLHGTGAALVPKALSLAGFTEVSLVAEQMAQDGAFPTVKSPNPEDEAALAMAIAHARALQADLVLGTDPDCDRVGAAVLHGGAYRLITGNQMGALLLDFIVRAGPKLPDNGAVVKTIVTGDLGTAIARHAGLTVFETLTGFKYIGEKIGQFVKSGAHAFVFGYEESYGYLAGTYARDKDAVVASLLIAEMAAFYKREGRTLVDALGALYAAYGGHAEALETIPIRSLDDTGRVMRALRADGGAALDPAAKMLDYLSGLDGLPPSDVLKFVLPGGAWVAVRPSGTEPTLKLYYAARGETESDAQRALPALKTRMRAAILAIPPADETEELCRRSH